MNDRIAVAAVVVLGAVLIWWGARRWAPIVESERESLNVIAAARSVDGAARSPRLAGGSLEQVDDEEGQTGEMDKPVDAGRVAGPPDPRRSGALAELEDGGTEASGDEGPNVVPPMTALENLRMSLRQYAARFGGNPVGDNAEITVALRGGNVRKSVFLTEADGIRISGEGELVDAWGTPYFFHQLSRIETEIRSAGPDRRMWTADDLLMK